MDINADTSASTDQDNDLQCERESRINESGATWGELSSQPNHAGVYDEPNVKPLIAISSEDKQPVDVPGATGHDLNESDLCDDKTKCVVGSLGTSTDSTSDLQAGPNPPRLDDVPQVHRDSVEPDLFLGDEEGGILNWLFRRSTLRKSRRRPRRSRSEPRSTRTSTGIDGEPVATISATVADAEDPQPAPEGYRKSFRKFFRRNDSFYRAQRNSIRQSGDRQAVRTQSDSTANRIGESLDRINDPGSLAATDNPHPILVSSLSSGARGSQATGNGGDGVHRNETRRSVRFTINPVTGSDPVQSESDPRPVAATRDNIIRSLLPPPLGTRQLRSSLRNGDSARQETGVPTVGGSVSSDYDDGPSVVMETDEERAKRVGFWPHLPCSMLAAMACTLGMGSICRFALLSFQYGGAFILQFIMLSISFGFPMVSFFMTLGQYMGCGIMGMWKISPIFQGIGVASLIATTLIGIYGIVPVSWFFVYFRDSFVTDGTIFKWGECIVIPVGRYYSACSNQTLTESFRSAVPQYFHSRVLQRTIQHPLSNIFSELKFENVFNLAVVWLLVFICLSKGLKSYGKVVFAFAIFPLIGFLIVAVEILRQAQAGTEYILKANTHMYDVFMSGSSWVAAGREAFFVWGINGAVLMQITSHNRFRHNIKRDSSIIILITLSTLLVAAFLGCACFSIIYRYERGRVKFLSSSFENERSMLFLATNPNPYPPIRNQWSNNLLLGEEMLNINTDMSQHTNYQVFRLVTELFPAALANLGSNNISPFWSVLLYLTLITFGIAQQLAIWRCVIEGIIAVKPAVMRSWETTITFVSCIMGFVLGLPFTTEIGIFVLYFMDFCVGSAWWIMLIYLAQILALFIVRGKPYSADDLVSLITPDKFSRKWLSNLIAFSWNVITPAGLLVLAITSFQNGKYVRIFRWFDKSGYVYWPPWVRQLGTFIQLIPLFIIPLWGLIQTCRYLGKGPRDLFDRLQLLYRPSLRTPPDGQQAIYSDVTGHSDGVENPGFTEDPPPKYTPPPSYNTATGLKLLKRLNSLRRSFRSSQSTSRQRSISNLIDVEMMAANGEQACCSNSLQVPFFISPQDLRNASTSRQTSGSDS